LSDEPKSDENTWAYGVRLAPASTSASSTSEGKDRDPSSMSTPSMAGAKTRQA
ncbi:unnamed protein product, partial [Amoebophrya sp. A25]